jgi:hypothetical protein
MTIQSRSPATSLVSFFGSSLRLAAMVTRLSDDDNFVLGLDGSTSRISRNISPTAALRNCSDVNGRVPVSNSYRITPSE